ncbi:hypothetical protein F5Y04DRAFT_247916 [Hypomontagnella monticulosa]|nr:hypothetical protein F5Y04DRAFT_247916 [Hypomontagnella monticulosa]
MSTVIEDYEIWTNTPYQDGQVLPTNHPYLCMLNGRYKNVQGEVREELRRQRSPEHHETTDHALSPLGNEYLRWEMEVVKVMDIIFSTIRIIFDPMSPTEATEIETDVSKLPIYSECCSCHTPIDLMQKHGHFSCRTCKKEGLEYSLCKGCAEAGVEHDSPGHSLLLVKTTEFRFGQAAKTYVKHSRISEPPPQDRPSPQATLSAVLREYLKKPGVREYLVSQNVTAGNSRYAATIGIQQWRAICCLLEREPGRNFRDFLHPIHRTVVRLILEWWLGEIQDIELSHLGINGLFPINLFRATSDTEETILGMNRSRYHSELLILFLMETGQISVSPSSLHGRRVASAHYASVQRLAFSHLSGTMRPPWHNPYEDVRINGGTLLTTMMNCLPYPMAVCFKKNHKETEIYFGTMVGACLNTWELALEQIRSAEQVLGPKQLNGSISPCPWLAPVKRDMQFPFYLWDKERRSTVRTQDLPYPPEYTVVSHTWGRWRKKSEIFPDVDLPGVPWAIPQNDRFDVEDIGDILRSVPGDSLYVWFDLVCIPQTRNGELGNRARQEIAKQAAIFSLADHAVAWFCNLDDFDPLEDICHLLAINAMRYPGGGTEDRETYCQRIDGLLKKFENIEPNLPLRRPQAPYTGTQSWNELLHEWFSSLWTLQEACMRPGMWLCCRGMKPLVSSTTGSKIPLDCIICLVLANAEVIREWSFPSVINGTTGPISSIPTDKIRNSLEYRLYESPVVNLIQSPPPYVIGFTRFVMAAGLTEIPDITQIGILTLGNQRTCETKSQRAEAIMSALGVTKWYNPNESNGQDKGQLVLEQYPLKFVKELRQEVGDYQFFFHNITRDFWAEINPTLFEEQLLARKDTRGTLLPFAPVISRRGGRIRRDHIPNTMNKSATHGTVAEWLINTDGSVVVTSAWLLVSTSNPDNVNLGTVFLSDFSMVATSGWGNVASEQILREWVSSRTYKCHAVGIQQEELFNIGDGKTYIRIDGILLRELQNGSLIKIGTFGTKMLEGDFGFSSRQDVNWTVI